MRRAIVGVVLALLAGVPLAGQGRRTLDRIVAVVGSRAILASQIEEQIVQLQAQGAQLPADTAARDSLRRRMLHEMIEEELLVQQAERDTLVKVTDQEVQDAVEQTVQNVRRQFASESEFQAQLKLAGFGSVEEWRRWLQDQQRRAIMRQRLLETLRQQGKLRPIPPTDAAMRDFWEKNRGQLPKRPAVVSFRQIIIVPRPDSAARARARQRAESLLVELRRGGGGGADFAATARRFSDDTATREAGGELGWFRRGVMVPAFEAVAFRLPPGQLSEPLETDFGFHIIKVERVQPAEVLARHILIRPAISTTQIALARRLADSVHAALAAGASFDSLARRHAHPDGERLVEDAPLERLPPEYRERLQADTTLGLKPVITLTADTARPRFVVLEVTGRQPEGDVRFEDVKDRIRERLSQELAVQHYLSQLRRQTLIDVRR